MPTYILKNPDAFIPKAGKSLSKTSPDKLSRLFNELKGDMPLGIDVLWREPRESLIICGSAAQAESR